MWSVSQNIFLSFTHPLVTVWDDKMPVWLRKMGWMTQALWRRVDCLLKEILDGEPWRCRWLDGKSRRCARLKTLDSQRLSPKPLGRALQSEVIVSLFPRRSPAAGLVIPQQPCGDFDAEISSHYSEWRPIQNFWVIYFWNFAFNIFRRVNRR